MRLTVPNLIPGQEYGVQVRADFDGEKSGWSARYDFTAAENSTVPDAPINVTWAVTGDAFYGEWDKVAYNDNAAWPYAIARYEIELVGGGITKIVSQTWTDEPRPSYFLDFATNVLFFNGPRATVTLRVRAVDVMGLTSPWSSPIRSATNPPPAPVTALTAQAIVDGVYLKWTAPTDDDLIGYHVYAKVGAGSAGFSPTALEYAGFSGSTNFTFNTSNYTIWHFIVVAVDKFNTESSIVRASATPTSPFLIDTAAPPEPDINDFWIETDHTVPTATMFVQWIYNTPPSDLADFLVRYRPTGSTPWEVMTIPSTDDLMTLEVWIRNLEPYVNYDVGVAARDFTGNTSTYTATTVVSADPNVAPSTPATPTASANTQQIQVVISGTKAAGGAMEADVAEYEVYASTTSGFTTYDSTTLVGKIPAGPAIVGTFTIPAASATPGATTQTWYVKIKAVDKGGLKSAASAQATSSVGLISTLNIADASITNAKIYDLSVTKLTAGTGLITDLTVKSILTMGDSTTNAYIRSWNYTPTGGVSGYEISKNAIIIRDGTIEAKALKIQDSQNLMPPAYADFEYTDAYYTNAFWGPRGQGKFYTEFSISYADQTAGLQKFNLAGLNCHSFGTNTAETFWFGEHSTNYNIDVEPGWRMIYSIYIKNMTGLAQPWNLRAKGNDGTVFLSQPITLNTGTAFQRYEVAFTVPAGVTKILMGTNKTQTTSPVAMVFDGAQVERVVAGLEVASPWKPPGMTSISGAGITSGFLRSNQNVTVNGIDQPLWSINLAGNAQFGDASVRGKIIVGPPTGTDAGQSFIASGNYVYGSAGWKIKDDGVAEFANIISRAPNNTRTTIENAANPYESGAQWNIISMYSTEATWSPAQLWTVYTSGSPSVGSLQIASPKLASAAPARIKMYSYSDNNTVLEFNSKVYNATADTYTFGDPAGSFIDFNMGYQAANSTQRWQFKSPGGKRIIFRFGTLGTNDILSENESSARIRLDLYASDMMFYNNAVNGGQIYLGPAAHANHGHGHPWFGSVDHNAGISFHPADGLNPSVRCTTQSGANLVEIYASVLRTSSDRNDKTYITKTKSVLEGLKTLEVYDYHTKQSTPEAKAHGKQRGLMAQEIEQVWPEAVVSDPHTDVKTVDVYYLLSTSIKAVQELSAKVDDLESQLASLSKK